MSETGPDLIRVLTGEEIAGIPWSAFGEVEGVATKTLWRDPYGASYAGLLKLESGAQVPVHAHHLASHHVWVLRGGCEIGGRQLGEDSYAFVPLGCDHGIRAIEGRGCLLFYLYLASAEPD